MKVILIAPSNITHMPYVRNYQKILNKMDVNYIILNWDRLNIEDSSKYTYKNGSSKMRRGFLEHYRYAKFVKDHLRQERYDSVIIFGLPMLFFLKGFLFKEDSKKKILDIRDKNRIIKFINMEKVLNKLDMVVISSERYKEWLPQGNYFINHNTDFGYEIIEEIERKPSLGNKQVEINRVLTIGTLRDYDINIEMISALKNSDKFELHYVGDGAISNQLKRFVHENQISNVVFDGRYLPNEESKYIDKADFISVLRYPDSENNKTALPNRLYSALLNEKPLLSYKGTYLGEIIKEYDLGLVLDNFDNLNEVIDTYLKSDITKYQDGRKLYLKKVNQENHSFFCSLNKLLKG